MLSPYNNDGKASDTRMQIQMEGALDAIFLSLSIVSVHAGHAFDCSTKYKTVI